MKLGMILTLTVLGLLVACGKASSPVSDLESGSGTGSESASYVSSFPIIANNLRISLTDAPSRELKSVFVNVDHAELFVSKNGVKARIIAGQGLGMVDLMTLRNGVLLPLQDLNLASGLQITGLRLVLKGDNNHAIKVDDSRCEMQTPSGQQSGIKIHLSQPFTLESGSIYSMVMDFDAAKSVVVKGNGGCLLKPVLKLMVVTKIPVDSNTGGGDSGNSDDPVVTPEPVTDGTDTNGSGGSTTPPTSDPNSSDTTSGGGSTGGGFEIPVDPVDEPPIINGDSTFTMG